MHNQPDVFSSLSDAIWAFDLTKQQFSYVNERLAEIFSTTLTDISLHPSSWLKYIHPDDYDYVLTETTQIYQAKNFEIEYRLLVRGTVKWVIDKRAVSFNENGSPIAISGILSDVTSKKASEPPFSSSEITFRYLFINNPNPLWIYDLKSLRFMAVNYAAISKYGYSREEFMAMTIADIRPTEDIPDLLESVSNISNTFYNSSKVWRHLKKNKELIYVNISGHGIKFQGRDAEIIMAHDVTEQIKIQHEIALAKENLDALINTMDDQIWSIDANYRILSGNIAFKIATTTVPGQELKIGESIKSVEFMGKKASVWRQQYERCLKGESFQVIEQLQTTSSISYFSETKFNPIVSGENVIGVACISRNIQERLEMQKNIIEQNNKLLELISIASHEIRGPIASILGLTDVFNHQNYSDPFNAEALQLIRGLAQELDSLIYTLVDKTYDLQQNTQAKYSAQQNQSMSE